MPAKPFRLKPVKPTEAQVQDAILRYLAVERRVVWSARMNSGKGKLLRPDGSQTWIKFGFQGCPDIMGQLTDGRYLAIECKRAGGRVRPEQRAHISLAADHGAVAMIARSVDDVQAALDAALSRTSPLAYAAARQALPVAPEPVSGPIGYPFPTGD